MAQYPKRLIEVHLPIGEINKARSPGKSIRHGHISTAYLVGMPAFSHQPGGDLCRIAARPSS